MDGTGRLFEALVRELPAEVVPRVVSYPSRERRSYDELLDEIAIPDGPFGIVAESFSGPLGIRLAARHADRVRALVLVATFVRNPSAVAASFRPFVHRSLFALPLPDLALRFALLGMEAPGDEVRALRAAIESVDPAVMAGRLRAIVDVDVRDEFRRLVTPVSFVAGARDRLVGPESLAEMRRIRPDMEVVVLDAPHLVLQRRPRDAAGHIARSLLERRGSSIAP
jgi:pimeloyl-ACP methyl ester carboxylesterase